MSRLPENAGVAFEGSKKGGAFEITREDADSTLAAPNPDGRKNSHVVRPWVSGKDLTGRPRDLWIIDFGEMSEEEAALYEAPFEHIREHVMPVRVSNRRKRRAEYWWQHAETVPGLRRATAELPRFLATVGIVQTPALRVARSDHASVELDRGHRAQRRLLLRRTPVDRARAVGPSTGARRTSSRGRKRLSLHADDHVRDFPVPETKRRTAGGNCSGGENP